MLGQDTPRGEAVYLDHGRILADLILGVIQQDFPSARLAETTKEDEALQDESYRDAVKSLLRTP
jgi:hypothetical protein